VNLRGIFPPIATPFTADGDVDFEALRFNVGRWMATSLRGLVVLGTTGEAAHVTPDEAERIIGAVREGVPADRVLIAGAGQDATRAAIAACRRAASAGANAVLVRTPSAFKTLMNGEALLRHYRAVADESPVPVLLYNFTAAFGVNLPTATIAQLAGHPNIIGMKESSGDLTQITEQVHQTRSDFIVLVGSAPTLYASLCVGAQGGVVASANVIPDLFIDLMDAAARGDHAEALRLQVAVTALSLAVTTGWGIPGLKAAMSLAGYRGGWPRAPLSPASDVVVNELRGLLAALPSAAPTRVAAPR
jgi:4-hydroxy-2-oxoglutarate aldolase